MKTIAERQRAQFERFSRTYEALHGPVVSAIHRVSQERYYGRCVGKRVLDIGNAGQPAAQVLGERAGPTLSHFVGVDHSFAMLQRTGVDFAKVVADGMCLPFKDAAFDYVIVNGVLHHLGRQAGEPPDARVHRLLREALRVCSEGLIVYELFTPRVLEQLERLALRVLGSMPTFVLSERTLDDCLARLGVARAEAVSMTLADLKGAFYWYAVVMDYEWLKLPAFLSPFRHSFFVLPKPAGG
jgi:ubiquinone/menaquinone biosynthesis C-methylase UbiE